MKIQVREHPQNGVDNNSNGICFEKALGFDHSHKKKWDDPRREQTGGTHDQGKCYSNAIKDKF